MLQVVWRACSVTVGFVFLVALLLVLRHSQACLPQPAVPNPAPVTTSLALASTRARREELQQLRRIDEPPSLHLALRMNYHGFVDGAHFAIRPRGPAAHPASFEANVTLL